MGVPKSELRPSRESPWCWNPIRFLSGLLWATLSLTLKVRHCLKKKKKTQKETISLPSQKLQTPAQAHCPGTPGFRPLGGVPSGGGAMACGGGARFPSHGRGLLGPPVGVVPRVAASVPRGAGGRWVRYRGDSEVCGAPNVLREE